MFSLRSIDEDQRVERRDDLLNLAEIRRSLSDHLDMCRIFTDEDEEKWIDLVRRREGYRGNEVSLHSGIIITVLFINILKYSANTSRLGTLRLGFFLPDYHWG